MAASTLDVNLKMQSNAFQAGAKGASAELKNLGQAAQRTGSTIGQVGGMIGSSLPMYGQLGGAISQVTGFAADFAAQAGKGGIAAAAFASGPLVLATGALSLMAGTIAAVNKGYADMAAAIEAVSKRTGELNAAFADPGLNAGLDPAGQMAQKAVETARRQREAVKSEMDKMGAPGFWTSADDKVTYAVKQSELGRLDSQIAVYQRKLEEARSRRDSQKQNEDGAAAMKAEMERWQARQEYDQEHEAALQKAADLEYEAAMAEANRLNDFELRQREALDRQTAGYAADFEALMGQTDGGEPKTPARGGRSGRASMFDRSLIDLEGLRANAEDPVMLQKQANQLLGNIQRGIDRLANNGGGIPG